MEPKTSTENDNLFTFQVDKVEICKKIPALVTAEKIMLEEIGITTKFEDFSHKDHKQESFIDESLPGFLCAIHTAYQNHYPLKLSVSDFIILIGQGLGRHINENAEELRKYFVNHEGKEMIEIFRNEFVLGEQNDWSTVFGEFADNIKERVKTNVYDVAIDDTSIATPVSRMVSEITLMDCMKSYFKYQVTTKCGIPQVTLEGSPEDWEKLRNKVRKLFEMNRGDCLQLEWWLKELMPVVDKICDTAVKKTVDEKFWSKIYKYRGGSGGPYISGWVMVFFPYLASGVNNFGLRTSDEIPKQVCQVPFIWKYYEKTISMTFYGGFLGASFDQDTKTVKPVHFWSVNHA